VAKVQYPVLPSVAFDAKPAELVRAAKELGLEDIIAKRKGSIYEPGRRRAWLKHKIYRSQESVIGGVVVVHLAVGVIAHAQQPRKIPRVRLPGRKHGFG